MPGKKTGNAVPKNDASLVKCDAPRALASLTEGEKLVNTALELVAGVLKQNPTPAALTFVADKLAWWRKTVESVEKATKETLKAYVLEYGEVDGSSHTSNFRVHGREVKATVQVQRHRLPDAAMLRALLVRKGLPEEAGFMQRIEVVPDEDRLAVLVAQKKLTEEELDECRLVKATALTVKV